MPRSYASGSNADVYAMHDRHEWRRHFPTADLVREECSSWSKQVDAKLLFYAHRVAGLLFPGHFIDVTGARMQGGATQLYSRRADVPEEHATYCNDIVALPMRAKHSSCSCEQCARHRAFHESQDLQKKAWLLAERLFEYGISVPTSDCTDYCQTSAGKVVFFELGLNHHNCSHRLEQQPIACRATQEHVLHLLKRIECLEQERRKKPT